MWKCLVFKTINLIKATRFLRETNRELLTKAKKNAFQRSFIQQKIVIFNLIKVWKLCVRQIECGKGVVDYMLS